MTFMISGDRFHSDLIGIDISIDFKNHIFIKCISMYLDRNEMKRIILPKHIISRLDLKHIMDKKNIPNDYFLAAKIANYINKHLRAKGARMA